MTLGPRRPAFYLGVLATGFVLGGFLSALLERFLSQSPAGRFFTTTVAPAIGPVSIDLIIFSLTLGPLVLRVSLLGILGIVIAYLVARSIF
jgi:hypothetical protein